MQGEKNQKLKIYIYIYIQREREREREGERERESLLCVKKQKTMHGMRERMTNLQHEDKNKKSKK